MKVNNEMQNNNNVGCVQIIMIIRHTITYLTVKLVRSDPIQMGQYVKTLSTNLQIRLDEGNNGCFLKDILPYMLMFIGTWVAKLLFLQINELYENCSDTPSTASKLTSFVRDLNFVEH